MYIVEKLTFGRNQIISVVNYYLWHSTGPFLATRVLKQSTLDKEIRFPLALTAALSDFHIDDILTGADNIHTALDLQRQLVEMLNSAGKEIFKWCSNVKYLLDQVPSNQNEYDFDEGKNNSVKILKLRWDPKENNFHLMHL